MIDRYTTGLWYLTCFPCGLINLTLLSRDMQVAGFRHPHFLQTWQTSGIGWMREPRLAERFDVANIAAVVDVRDEGDMGVGPAGNSQLVCDITLQMGQSKHVGACGSEHIIGSEDDFHMEKSIPDNALDKLQAGAIVQALVRHRIPCNGDCPPALGSGKITSL